MRLGSDTDEQVCYTAGSIGIWADEHRWTLSSHLWNAPDSFEFYRAWREKPSFAISNFDFAGFLESGKPEDVDSFARIFLTL